MTGKKPGKREETQSIAVSDEERFLLRVLAKSQGIKPATAARFLLYRGLAGYLRDHSLRGLQDETEIFTAMSTLIKTDARLKKAKELLESEIAAQEEFNKKMKLPRVQPANEIFREEGKRSRKRVN